MSPTDDVPIGPQDGDHGGRISGDQFLPEIRRARLQRLTIYEVEESELALLERGAPDSIFLNLGIAFLTAAVTLTATLLTAEFHSHRMWTAFVVVTVIGYLAGATMLILWWQSRRSVSGCVDNIRKRLSTPWLDEDESGEEG